MRTAENNPLPVASWLSELEDLSASCATGAVGEEDRAVRRAFYLFELSAPSIRSLADAHLEESALELSLERAGPEAATRLIAGPRASFVTASSPDAEVPWEAEISFDGGSPVRGEGASPAYAMVSAWANFFRMAG